MLCLRRDRRLLKLRWDWIRHCSEIRLLRLLLHPIGGIHVGCRTTCRKGLRLHSCPFKIYIIRKQAEVQSEVTHHHDFAVHP